jgi:hypothetical protein
MPYPGDVLATEMRALLLDELVGDERLLNAEKALAKFLAYHALRQKYPLSPEELEQFLETEQEITKLAAKAFRIVNMETPPIPPERR